MIGCLPDRLLDDRHVTEGDWPAILSPEVGEDGVRVSAAVLITPPARCDATTAALIPLFKRAIFDRSAHETPALAGVFREEYTDNRRLDLPAGLPGKRLHYVGV